MAISQMQKITMIAPRSHLDGLLTSVQRLRRVQVNDIQSDVADEQTQSLIKLFDEQVGEYVYDDEALQSLSSRRQRIAQAIEQLALYESKESLWQKLTKDKATVDYDTFVDHNQRFPEQQVIEKANHWTEQLKSIDNQIEKHKASIDKYRKWKELDVLPIEIQNFRYIKAMIGTIPNVESNTYIQVIRKHPSIEHKIVFLNDHEYGLILFYQEGEEEALETLMQEAKFASFDYPYATLPGEKIDEWEQEIAILRQDRQAIVDQLKHTKEELIALKQQSDFVKSEFERESTKKKVGVTRHLVAVEGWIEAEEVPTFTDKLKTQFGDEIVIRSSQVQEEEVDDVPIKLKNNSLVAPFELVTKMYALPKYNEIDPTPFLMPFYFVFFGMMVADLGYGLLTSLGCFAALKLFKLDDNMKNTVRFGFILGLGISLWGFLYGSFFGFSLPIQLINPNQDVMLILGISVGLGLIHIFTALGLNVYLQTRSKNYVEAYSGGLAWILLLLGLLLLAVGMFDSQYALLGQIGKWLAILNAIGIVVASCIKAGGIGGLGWGLYDLYGITGYVGDLVSYTRLMALGLSGGSISLAFNMIIQFLPGAARWTVGILLFVLLHALSIFLSMLSAYVHGARLIFVEFFAKFYQGGGKPFEPLTISEEYVTVKDDLGHQ